MVRDVRTSENGQAVLKRRKKNQMTKGHHRDIPWPSVAGGKRGKSRTIRPRIADRKKMNTRRSIAGMTGTTGGPTARIVLLLLVLVVLVGVLVKTSPVRFWCSVDG